MSADRRAIHDAYRRTTYRATLDGECVDIRIGEPTPLLDALLRARGASTWAFVTASNPHATRLSEGENARRHADLVRAATALGFAFFSGESAGEDGAWPAERSLLIVGISEATAITLARGFAQEAIVVGALEQVARLTLCAGAGA